MRYTGWRTIEFKANNRYCSITDYYRRKYGNQGNTATDQVSVFVNPTPPNAIRINAGGSAQNFNGVLWSADNFFGTGSNVYSANTPISGTVIDAVYQSERWGSSFTYNIPVPNGTYSVNLHFAEIFWDLPGQRVFNVNLENGQGALTNFDILASTPKNSALIRNFTVTVTDGNLTLAFTSLVNNAKVSGIEIIPAPNESRSSNRGTLGATEIMKASPLGVIVAPNPSPNDFRLHFSGGDNTPASIRVANATGIIVEQFRDVDAKQSLRLGQRYPKGTYFVEIIQSGNRKVLTLIKQ